MVFTLFTQGDTGKFNVYNVMPTDYKCFRTTPAATSVIWNTCHERGRLRSSFLYSASRRPTFDHLLVLPRIQHHLGPRNLHDADGSHGESPHDPLCRAQAPGHLHLQSRQHCWDPDRDCQVECKWYHNRNHRKALTPTQFNILLFHDPINPSFLF